MMQKKNGIEIGLNKGIKKGFKQGIEQGIEKEKIKILKHVLKNNLSIDEVEKLIGIPKDKINELLLK